MAGKSASVQVAIVGDNRSLQRALGDSQNRLKSFGRTAAKVAVAAGAAAAVGLGVLAKASIDAASDAQQSLGATETVFGKFAKNVINTSDQAAEALGLSANSYRENANVLGSLLANQGVAADKLAGKTKSLITTGADLAATFGGTTTEAVEALASAFKGEFDPLEKYGVSIKQSAINTEAMRVAGVKTTAAFDDLTDAQKAAAKQTATTNLLTKQTAKTQGAFGRETDTLAHQQQVLAAQFDDVRVKIGNALLPVVTDLTEWVGDRLVPKLEDLADWLHDNQDEISDLGDKAAQAGEDLLGVADALGDLLGWFNDLPGPVKTLTFQVGLAVATFWKLQPVLLATNTQLRSYATTASTAAGRTALLGSAAKKAAGVAGFALLTSGMTDAATEGADLASVLSGTLGGAMVGLAVGGPIGALVGAAAGGGLTALIGAFQETGDEARAARLQLLKTEGFTQAKQDADDLRQALIGVVNAYGAIPRAKVKEGFFGEDGKLDKDIQLLRDAGVSMDTLVSATMGQAGAGKIAEQAMFDAMNTAIANAAEAQRAWDDAKDGVSSYRNEQGQLVTQHISTADQEKIKAAWEAANDAVAEVGIAQDTFYDRISRNTGAIEDHRAQVKQLAADLGVTVKQYNAFPKDVRTEFEGEGLRQTFEGAKRLIAQYKGLQDFKSIKAVVSAPGVNATGKQIKELGKRYKLTPSQVTTLIKLEGAQKSQEQARDVRKEVERTRNTPGKLDKFVGDVRADIGKAKTAAAAGAGDIITKLKSKTHEAKADLGPFKASVKTGTSQAARDASTGGSSVGAALKAGVLSGASGLGPALDSQMRAAVRQGIDAARDEADAHSPSRETEKLGKDLAKGVVVGVQKGSEGITAVLRRMTDRVTKLLDSQLADRQRVIKKRLDGKAEAAALKRLQARWKAHAKAVKKALKDEYEALRQNAKRQDEVTKKLQTAKDHLTEVLDFRNAVKAGAIDFANITALDVAFNPKVMVAEMQHRLEKIRWFNSILQDLVSKGLNKETLNQLAQAGVEGGLAAALALQQGGQSAVTDINKIQDQINSAAGQLGTTAADSWFDVGVAASQGIVDGLESQRDKLDAMARKLARQLVHAIRQELNLAGGKGKGGGGLGRLVFDPSTVSGTSGTTATKPAAAAAPVAPVHNTYEIRVTAPVGSSPAEIGRTITYYIDSYQKAGGRRRG